MHDQNAIIKCTVHCNKLNFANVLHSYFYTIGIGSFSHNSYTQKENITHVKC